MISTHFLPLKRKIKHLSKVLIRAIKVQKKGREKIELPLKNSAHNRDLKRFLILALLQYKPRQLVALKDLELGIIIPMKVLELQTKKQISITLEHLVTLLIRMSKKVTSTNLGTSTPLIKAPKSLQQLVITFLILDLLTQDCQPKKQKRQTSQAQAEGVPMLQEVIQ